MNALPMTLADASEAYQALLEGHRAHPEDDELHEDMLKAKQEMEIVWLRSMRTTRQTHR